MLPAFAPLGPLARVAAQRVAAQTVAAQTVAAQTALSSTSFVLAWSAGPLAQDKGSPIAESSPIVATWTLGPAVVVGDRAGYLYAYHLPTVARSRLAGLRWRSTDRLDPVGGPPGGSRWIPFLLARERPAPGPGGLFGLWGQRPAVLAHARGRPRRVTSARLRGAGVPHGVRLAEWPTTYLPVRWTSCRTPSTPRTASVLPGNWPFFSADSNFSTAAAGDLYGTGQPELVMGGASTRRPGPLGRVTPRAATSG